MSEQQTPVQEASKAIVSWAKQSYQPLSTADDEMAAMERAGILKGTRVDLISIEPIDDMWKARLAIAGGRFDIIVTFWLDDIHQLEENRLHIEEIQEAPGTDVPPLNEQQWKNPNVEPIHPAGGRVVKTEVNGKAMDGRSGSVFVDGRDIVVMRNTSDAWEEVAKESRYYLAIGDRNHADKWRDCKSDDLEKAVREAVEEFEKLQAAGNAPVLLRVIDSGTRIVERAITADNFARAKQRLSGQPQSYTYTMLGLGDVITYTQARIDARYASEFGDQKTEDGPFTGRIVDFPDSDGFSPYSRVGVRIIAETISNDGLAPLYYVQLQDIVKK